MFQLSASVNLQYTTALIHHMGHIPSDQEPMHSHKLFTMRISYIYTHMTPPHPQHMHMHMPIVLREDMTGLRLSSILSLLLLLLTTASALRDVPGSSSSSSKSSGPSESPAKIQLPLHHLSTATPPPTSTLLDIDSLRADFLLTTALSKTSTSTPLHSGLPLGIGNYVTQLRIGTPPSTHHLIFDTGSSLTWLQCAPCKLSCYTQDDPLYQPNSSSTFSSLTCSSPFCSSLRQATLNPPGCSPSHTCTYQATYGDSSYSLGHMGMDTLFLGSSVLPSFAFGCGDSNVGLFGRTSGIIGLARSRLSLLTQLGSRYPNAFSYCLPTPAGEGYLSIGDYNPTEYRFTPLLSDPLGAAPLYFVKLVSVIVGSKAINVPTSTYGSMRTIIDSGTVITRLPARVLEALSLAVEEGVRGYKRTDGYSILETCWEGRSEGMSGVPEVRMVFEGGAEMRLGKGNVMYDVSGKNLTCLAFARSRGVAIVGNRQQQTLKVVYDVGGSRIGFAAGGCS